MTQTNVISEFVDRKADMLVRDGRLSFERFYGLHARIERWRVEGNSGVYRVIYDAPHDEYRCSCPAANTCSHILAVSKVRRMVMEAWPV